MNFHTPQIPICISPLPSLILYKATYVSAIHSHFKKKKKKKKPRISKFLQTQPICKNMATNSVFPVRSLKHRSAQRCSKQVREQKARLYIIWRCTVLLLCWHD
ncbi:hypothetical protein Pfo_006270 [Paulownia fortunei]|nr:hypothetical protein Pfo_006270 [Paulownia fortunei]